MEIKFAMFGEAMTPVTAANFRREALARAADEGIEVRFDHLTGTVGFAKIESRRDVCMRLGREAGSAAYRAQDAKLQRIFPIAAYTVIGIEK